MWFIAFASVLFVLLSHVLSSQENLCYQSFGEHLFSLVESL